MIGPPRAALWFVRVGAWLVTSTSLGGLATAQTPDFTEHTSTPPASATVELVLVGQADSQALAELVQATLAREGVASRLSRARALREADLLERPDATGGAPPRIWVDLVTVELARLYFADAHLGRYLVRDVPLRSGLDELGRERIAQVIETSTLALLSGEAAMSREQFASSLQTLEASSPPDTEVAPEPRPTESPRSQRTGPTLGVAYQSYWSGPELGLLHGPALRVGLRRDLARGAFLATLVVAPSFPQLHQERGVEVRVQSTALRLLLGTTSPLRRDWSWVAVGGGGVSLSQISPHVVDEDWSEKPARTNVTPWLQAELGVSWELSRLMLSTAFSSQLSLVDTHYDHVRGNEPERLFTPWVWQPGGVVGLTWY